MDDGEPEAGGSVTSPISQPVTAPLTQAALFLVVTVPLMSVGGLPVGVQLMGQQHEDARMTGLARWFSENLQRVAMPA